LPVVIASQQGGAAGAGSVDSVKEPVGIDTTTTQSASAIWRYKMPSAKAIYDHDEKLKFRQIDPVRWEALSARLKQRLRPFYPLQENIASEWFGHPADASIDELISEAWSSISMFAWSSQLTKAQILKENQEILKNLHKAASSLDSVSADVQRLFELGADVRGTRDKILELIQHIEGSSVRIDSLPKALKKNEVDHKAAVEMAIRVLRVYKRHGGRISATADTDLNYQSHAVTILKGIGDELGLVLSAATWKKVVTEVRQLAGDL
jgi:small-conductance mechanosensitive channel